MVAIGNDIEEKGLFLGVCRKGLWRRGNTSGQSVPDLTQEGHRHDKYEADHNPGYAAVDALDHTCDTQVVYWHYYRGPLR